MSENNPDSALEALTAPDITLGQIALLERIGCPILTSEGDVSTADLVPSAYIYTHPAPEVAARFATLEADAYAWVDTLTREDYIRTCLDLQRALLRFVGLSPSSSPSGQKKTDSPEKAG